MANVKILTRTAKGGGQLTPPLAIRHFRFVFDDFAQTAHTSSLYDFFVIKLPKFIIYMRQRRPFCCEMAILKKSPKINAKTIKITSE